MLIATMIATFVAAGGLVASAWTGYYQVKTSQDQLAQSKEDSEKELQSQASRVSSWTMEGKSGKTTGYFANRSLDPISQVTIGVATGSDSETNKGQEGLYPGEKQLLDLRDVPPCSIITIWTPGNANHFAVAGFSFVDVRGQRWGRAGYKPLKAMDLPAAAPIMGDNGHGQGSATWKLLFGDTDQQSLAVERPGSTFSNIPPPKPLKDCGADKN
ncbi:hypothetical protein [Streptomyces sp. NBC_01445]|uniref:hypothetical protein n=1 Tax=Streptomyces sp. NBC_01445 TaxID=2903869 RepID=UPI002DDA71E4|nr:hypothetical protein [Streptomyces sp. NBC_01445]WSE02033.1 hypothetical protein OG574_00455 [Streptomyces sp. NBC_01445]WSE10297.1 hypothetical protein OG574_47555 [Streptomyces sp. NBC_01445]WSE11135.1 hypothetical protein OG574_48465 [Streptomyces sp. NBC_01445]